MPNYASKVIDIALNEVGYLEKKSNKDLDSNTANAGSANYTKYARDFKTFAGEDYQAQPWCDMFVDWCFVKAYGVDAAKKLLGGFDAYTPGSAERFKSMGRWYTSPRFADVIFFKNSSRICHTGLVVEVKNGRVYTVEGNTSDGSEIIANGGAVCRKSYDLNNSRIAGYGRPKYDAEPAPQPQQPQSVSGYGVRAGRKWLNTYYGDLLKKHTGGLLADSSEYDVKARNACVCVWKDVVNRKYGKSLNPGNFNFYDSSKEAAKSAAIRYGSDGTLVVIAQIILAALGYYIGKIDGSFGTGTKSAVMAYQKAKGLSCDGVIGSNTWFSLFN